jgi:hypothetical protein
MRRAHRGAETTQLPQLIVRKVAAEPWRHALGDRDGKPGAGKLGLDPRFAAGAAAGGQQQGGSEYGGGGCTAASPG